MEKHPFENRRIMRELAVQVLYMWETLGQPDEEAAKQSVSQTGVDEQSIRRGLEWARSVWGAREIIDPMIDKVSTNWPVRRMSPVDRQIVRLSVWEITHTENPQKAIIDEAVEIAKEYSTKEAPAFVNGVLDAVLKNHLALTKT